MSQSEDRTKVSVSEEVIKQLFKDLKDSRVHKCCPKVFGSRFERKIKRDIEKHQKELVVLRGKREEVEEKLEAKKKEVKDLKEEERSLYDGNREELEDYFLEWEQDKLVKNEEKARTLLKDSIECAKLELRRRRMMKSL